MSRFTDYLEISRREESDYWKWRLGSDFGRYVHPSGKIAPRMGRKIKPSDDDIAAARQEMKDEEDLCYQCHGTGQELDREMSEYDERGRLEHARYKKCEACDGKGK